MNIDGDREPSEHGITKAMIIVRRVGTARSHRKASVFGGRARWGRQEGLEKRKREVSKERGWRAAVGRSGYPGSPVHERAGRGFSDDWPRDRRDRFPVTGRPGFQVGALV